VLRAIVVSRKRKAKSAQPDAEAVVEETVVAEGSGPHAAASELREALEEIEGGVREDEAALLDGDLDGEVGMEVMGEVVDERAGDGDVEVEAEAVAAGLEVDGEVAGEVAGEGVLPTSAVAFDAVQLKYLVEALVFASDKPVTVQRLRQLTRVADVRRLEQALADLAEDYRERGLILQTVSGGYQFRTRTAWSAWVQQLIAGRPVRLTRAQLETLAILAYRQPITRPEIDDIRGVDSSATLKLLLDRGLIRALGKREEVGRPTLFGTTKEFLDFFSLSDLRELPTLREYSELTDESRRVISDRLGDEPPAADAHAAENAATGPDAEARAVAGVDGEAEAEAEAETGVEGEAGVEAQAEVEVEAWLEAEAGVELRPEAGVEVEASAEAEARTEVGLAEGEEANEAVAGEVVAGREAEVAITEAAVEADASIEATSVEAEVAIAEDAVEFDANIEAASIEIAIAEDAVEGDASIEAARVEEVVVRGLPAVDVPIEALPRAAPEEDVDDVPWDAATPAATEHDHEQE
jgi:segregation and condensation protein B